MNVPWSWVDQDQLLTLRLMKWVARDWVMMRIYCIIDQSDRDYISMKSDWLDNEDNEGFFLGTF